MAVTSTRTFEPSSATPSVYVRVVAPVIATNPAPESRCHWYAYVLPIPVHVPGVALSAEARWAVPAIAGAAVLTGGALGIVAVAGLATLTVPSALLAVTNACSFAFSSATPSRYVVLVAPAMFDQLAPLSVERCH